MNCVNCGIATNRSNATGSILLEDQAVLSIVRGWTGLQTINNEHCVCSSCWTMAYDLLMTEQKSDIESTPKIGHRRVCVRCGRSVLRKRSHNLNCNTEREARIQYIINEWIFPNRVELTSQICHPCWMRADKGSRHLISEPSSQASTDSSAILQEESSSYNVQIVTKSNYVSKIVLPDYVRAAETESKCFIQGCQGKERNRLPLSTRKSMLQKYNYYIPMNSRICDHHKQNDSWQLISGSLENYSNDFTAEQIQDMLSLKNP